MSALFAPTHVRGGVDSGPAGSQSRRSARRDQRAVLVRRLV